MPLIDRPLWAKLRPAERNSDNEIAAITVPTLRSLHNTFMFITYQISVLIVKSEEVSAWSEFLCAAAGVKCRSGAGWHGDFQPDLAAVSLP